MVRRSTPIPPSLPSIGFVGGGNMARSLIGGLVATGMDPRNISVSDPLPEAVNYLAETYQVLTAFDNRDVVSSSSILILAVKPQVMREALQSVQDELQSRQPLLISIAAGIRLAELDKWSGGGLAIVRVMPNTPALIQKGISGMYANPLVSEMQRIQAQAILNAVGKIIWIEKESTLDAVTAISGSGPAYFFYLIEALEKAAGQLGMTTDDAHLLATQTAIGAAHLAAQSNEPASVLRAQVTSPGGTTEKALDVLNSNKVNQSIVKAVLAAEQRSVELSEIFKNTK